MKLQCLAVPLQAIRNSLVKFLNNICHHGSVILIQESNKNTQYVNNSLQRLLPLLVKHLGCTHYKVNCPYNIHLHICTCIRTPYNIHTHAVHVHQVLLTACFTSFQAVLLIIPSTMHSALHTQGHTIRYAQRWAQHTCIFWATNFTRFTVDRLDCSDSYTQRGNRDAAHTACAQRDADVRNTMQTQAYR